MDLHFGAIADPLVEQMDAQGIKYNPDDAHHWQLDHDAIQRIYCRHMLTRTEANTANKRLMKRIAKEIGEFNNAATVKKP